MPDISYNPAVYFQKNFRHVYIFSLLIKQSDRINRPLSWNSKIGPLRDITSKVHSKWCKIKNDQPIND